MSPHAADRCPCLVADIGGSNARFGWMAAPGEPVRHVRTLPVARSTSLADAAREYLRGLIGELGTGAARPQRAAFAVATPVTGDEVRFTNSGWHFGREALRQALGLRELRVLNDFEALALALPGLRADQVRAQGERPAPTGTLAVVGPGTGLGVAAVLRGGTGWLAVPGEGGHATLAAADDTESALIAQARRSHPHVSAERLLSGVGLPVLHAAVCALAGHATEALGTEAIVARGLSGEDPLASRTLDHFCALLGSFAGNVALTFGARGGLYVGGGIVPRLGERFFASRFRERFEAKGRFRAYLRQVPTALITDTLVALDGAAAALHPDAA